MHHFAGSRRYCLPCLSIGEILLLGISAPRCSIEAENSNQLRAVPDGCTLLCVDHSPRLAAGLWRGAIDESFSSTRALERAIFGLYEAKARHSPIVTPGGDLWP
jgi:hypothetical protein